MLKLPKDTIQLEVRQHRPHGGGGGGGDRRDVNAHARIVGNNLPTIILL